MKKITYATRRLLVEEGRALRRTEAALHALKKEWEKLKQIQHNLKAAGAAQPGDDKPEGGKF